jgi:hypothetical protein
MKSVKSVLIGERGDGDLNCRQDLAEMTVREEIVDVNVAKRKLLKGARRWRVPVQHHSQLGND